MTDEQINAAIAEACGWRKEDGVYVWNGNGIDRTCWELWDYCNDLNAMHEVEKNMCKQEFFVYLRKLPIGPESITATARQRAEALLRTLGKWEEAE